MPQPPFVPWSQRDKKSYTKGGWRDLQLGKFLDFNIDCNSGDVKRWLVNHDVDPWPGVTTKNLRRHFKRLRADRNTPDKQKKREDLALTGHTFVCYTKFDVSSRK